MRLEEGASFARYTVETSLGGGGMGHVYRAFDPQLQRRIALKILDIDPDGAPGGAAAALILREARAAAALNHVNAVTVFEIGEHNGVPFLAMELVQGQPLRKLVGRRDIPLGRRLRWLMGIADALAAAHSAGIVHLDVKPENVIVRDDDIAKVLDFGIARRHTFNPDILVTSQRDVEKLHTLTNGSGSIVGTPRYMAPEQVGRSELSGRTDQFAWGVVAYELLTGQSPWPPGDSLFELFSHIVRSEPEELRTLCPEAPEAVAAIILRAMSKLASDRFETMNDLLAALADASADLGTGSAARPSGILRLNTGPLSDSELETLRADPNAKTVDVASIDLTPPPEPHSGEDAHATLPSPSSDGQPPTQRSGEITAPSPIVGQSKLFSRVITALLAATLTVVIVWALSTPSQPQERSLATPLTATSAETTSAPSALCKEAAQRAFASGARALRSGNWGPARASFQKAVASDPECAAAHARLVVIGYWTDPPSKTSDALRHALDLRDRLDVRDRELLHCYESVLWSTPPDERGFAACLDRLSEAHPNDAELAFIASDFAPQPARMRELAKRALDIDPLYSDAWQALAVAHTLEENEPAALDALNQCITHVTTSLDCIGQRAMLLRRMGKCSEVESTGRTWIARSPSSTGAYYTLGAALAAQGKPRAVVEEAMTTRWAQAKDTEDAGREPTERAALSALFGDFEPALQQARSLETSAKAKPDVGPRIEASLWLLDLGLEMDNLKATGELASDLWSRKTAWDAAVRRMAFNTRALMFEPQLLRVLQMTKRMPDAEVASARAQWIDDARARSSLKEEGIWLLGHALLAETKEQATEAVRVMPQTITGTMSWTIKLPGLVTYAYAGRALLLSGRPGDALPLLRRAAVSCTALEDPLLHTQATLWLGQALAQEGDRKGACGAFGTVIRRWGQASASRTAALAKTKAAALGCAP